MISLHRRETGGADDRLANHNWELAAKEDDGSQRDERPRDRMHMKYNDGRQANRLAPGLARLSSPCERSGRGEDYLCLPRSCCRQQS